LAKEGEAGFITAKPTGEAGFITAKPTGEAGFITAKPDCRLWLTRGVFDAHRRRMLTAAQIRRHPELLPTPRKARPSAALQDEPSEA